MDAFPNPILFSPDDREIPFENKDQYIDWLNKVAQSEGKTIVQLCYNFCSDERLLEINKTHLNHDYFTDIITFPYAYEQIESDIFISIDRVIDNAKELDVSESEELKRVMVHGLLHMCGYDDANPEEKENMRVKESFYLNLF